MTTLQQATPIDARFSRSAPGPGQVTWAMAIKNTEDRRELTLHGTATVRAAGGDSPALGSTTDPSPYVIGPGKTVQNGTVVHLLRRPPPDLRMKIENLGTVRKTGERVAWSGEVKGVDLSFDWDFGNGTGLHGARAVAPHEGHLLPLFRSKAGVDRFQQSAQRRLCFGNLTGR